MGWLCRECGRSFQNENNLNMVRAHIVLVLVAHTVLSYIVFPQHMMTHQAKAYRCPGRGCQQSFVSPSAVVLHLEAGRCPSGVNRALIDKYIIDNDIHNVITNPRRMITGGASGGSYIPPPINIATPAAWNGQAYECYLCHSTFRALNALNQHLASPRHSTANGTKIYRCPNGTCGQHFNALSALVQHIERGSCGVQRFSAVQNTIRGFVGGVGRLLTN